MLAVELSMGAREKDWGLSYAEVRGAVNIVQIPLQYRSVENPVRSVEEANLKIPETMQYTHENCNNHQRVQDACRNQPVEVLISCGKYVHCLLPISQIRLARAGRALHTDALDDITAGHRCIWYALITALVSADIKGFVFRRDGNPAPRAERLSQLSDEPGVCRNGADGG